MSAKKTSPIRIINTQLGRYMVHGTSTATEKNEFFLHFILENMSIQQVTVVVFYRPQNGTFLVLTTGVVTHHSNVLLLHKRNFFLLLYKGIAVYRMSTVVPLLYTNVECG